MTLLPVTLDGRDYLLDVASYQRATVQPNRDQADTAGEYSETSITPDDLWRRSQTDWRLGAGQRWLDKDPPEAEERRRFAASRGVDPWERGELTLLHDTDKIRTDTEDAPQLLVVDDRLWVVAGDRLAYTDDGVTWAETDAFVEPVRSITSDGVQVYAAVRDDAGSSGGVYKVSRAVTTPVLVNTVVPDLVAYVKGRLMIAAGTDLYNVTDPADTTPPEPLTPTAIVEDWRWTAFAATGAFILVAGKAGDQSAVYRITIRQDGTELEPPTVAAPLPAGEVVHSLAGYVGVVAIGTSKGLRVGTMDGGEIRYGPYHEVGPVVDLETQGRFVWFTWPEPHDGAAGLGRADLSTFLPAREFEVPYASDLLVDSAAAPYSVATWDGKRVFSLAGDGVYLESDGYLAEGWIQGGDATFGLPDRKVLEYLQVRTDELPDGASVEWQVNVDGQTASGLLVEGTGTDPEEHLGGMTGDLASWKLTLAQEQGDPPVVTRVTLRAAPIARPAVQHILPLVLRPSVRHAGRSYHYDVAEELKALEGLWRAGEPVTLRLFDVERRVFIDGLQIAEQWDYLDTTGMQGTVALLVKEYGIV